MQELKANLPASIASNKTLGQIKVCAIVRISDIPTHAPDRLTSHAVMQEQVPDSEAPSTAHDHAADARDTTPTDPSTSLNHAADAGKPTSAEEAGDSVEIELMDVDWQARLVLLALNTSL